MNGTLRWVPAERYGQGVNDGGRTAPELDPAFESPMVLALARARAELARMRAFGRGRVVPDGGEVPPGWAEKGKWTPAAASFAVFARNADALEDAIRTSASVEELEQATARCREQAAALLLVEHIVEAGEAIGTDEYAAQLAGLLRRLGFDIDAPRARDAIARAWTKDPRGRYVHDVGARDRAAMVLHDLAPTRGFAPRSLRRARSGA